MVTEIPKPDYVPVKNNNERSCGIGMSSPSSQNYDYVGTRIVASGTGTFI